MLFSIVIPLFNKESHIEAALQSVLDQTLTDFEIIVVDDHSTDDSLLKVRQYADSRIKIARRDRPGPGGYAARNLGNSIAKGEFVAYLDADDTWHKCHLELMRNAMLENPNVGFFISNYCYDANFSSDLFDNSSKGFSFVDYLLGKVDFYTSCVCVKNDVELLKGVFPEGRMRRGGDVLAWTYLLSHLKSGVSILHPTVFYRTNAENMVTKTTPYTDMEFTAFFEFYRNMLPILSLSTQEKKIFRNWTNQKIIYCFNQNLKHQFQYLPFLKVFFVFPLTTLKEYFYLLISVFPTKVLNMAIRLIYANKL